MSDANNLLNPKVVDADEAVGRPAHHKGEAPAAERAVGRDVAGDDFSHHPMGREGKAAGERDAVVPRSHPHGMPGDRFHDQHIGGRGGSNLSQTRAELSAQRTESRARPPAMGRVPRK